jgi:D-glucosaminate-6-phosphate ammonia-lyase
MKVGKEEIVGLIVALRRFLARDHAAERVEQERRLTTILAAVDGLRGVRVERLGEQDAPRAYPTGVIRIDEVIVEKSVAAIVNELIEGDPPVAVTQNFLHERGIGIVTALLKPGEEEIVARRLRAVLG